MPTLFHSLLSGERKRISIVLFPSTLHAVHRYVQGCSPFLPFCIRDRCSCPRRVCCSLSSSVLRFAWWLEVSSWHVLETVPRMWLGTPKWPWWKRQCFSFLGLYFHPPENTQSPWWHSVSSSQFLVAHLVQASLFEPFFLVSKKFGEMH